MVILVAGCRGAVFTVAVEEWSGLVETFETTDDTIERSTVEGTVRCQQHIQKV